MKDIKQVVIPILLATIWISLSEFGRNEFLLNEYWTNHYSNLGLVFPAEPINGALWGLWSLLYAIFIYVLAKKFNLIETTLISWFAGFVLMWVVTGNMGVLPLGILLFAVPLSILEAFIASFIIHKMQSKPS